LLTGAQRKRGIICASAGNHAQGVAFAADRMGIRATIVMPESAPQIKIEQTRLYGDPEIILHGRDLADSTQKAYEIQKQRGSVFVHAYDDHDVIAGQGTLGLEILDQCPAVDTIVVPVGGGGLISGIALAVESVRPKIRVIGVQAKGADAVARALETGSPVALDSSRTIADGINVRVAGTRAVEILTKRRIPVVRVTDEQIRAAMIALCQTAKLVVEPSGAASSAAVLFHPQLFEGSSNIVAVVSGANVNICCYAAILQRFPKAATEDAGITCASCTGGEKPEACLGSLADLLGGSTV
jgi:threonine dehydratase